MKLRKYHGGLALMIIGASLLLISRLAGWQSNAELLIALLIIVTGYISYLWLQKHGEKY